MFVALIELLRDYGAILRGERNARGSPSERLICLILGNLLAILIWLVFWPLIVTVIYPQAEDLGSDTWLLLLPIGFALFLFKQVGKISIGHWGYLSVTALVSLTIATVATTLIAPTVFGESFGTSPDTVLWGWAIGVGAQFSMQFFVVFFREIVHRIF